MALFSRKTKKETSIKAEAVASVATPGLGMDLAGVIGKPRITEKASDSASRGVYVFDVPAHANKKMIALAINRLYKVTPVKVAIAAVPSKMRRSARTGKVGVKKGGKKAYVYLKSGDSIALT